jgi:peptidoglycan/xylan/chitin deacetylase (PgdA/CDA1 family)
MYHRIARPPVDPWGLAVRPENFEQHLEVLCRSRHPLPLSEFVERLEQGTLPRDAVAVTFDDGYVDNLREAKPRLEACAVPATVFVTTGTVGQRHEYWWDELARGILLRSAPLDCEVEIAGERCRLQFAAPEGVDGSSTWRTTEQPRTGRESTYLSVWRKLQVVPARERRAAMDRLRTKLDPAPADEADLPMTGQEIASLSSGGLVQIGGHTVTHPVLPTLDPVERRREILDGKLACERFAGRQITGFAYPHGALDADSRAAVHESGFLWACSTDGRTVSAHEDDPLALPRVAVPDVDGPTFSRMLNDVCQ